MRIISLDLLLGTPRLQRRLEAERLQLKDNLAALRTDTRQLRNGVAQAATSLPALAIVGLSGFAIGKMARAPRRSKTDDANTGSSLTGTLGLQVLWQALMPMAFNWIQARLTPPDPTPDATSARTSDTASAAASATTEPD